MRTEPPADDSRTTPTRSGPIFVMGTMGSGTTLLRLMLDSHDSIAIGPETGFMRTATPHEFIPFRWAGRDWAARLGWSREEMDALLADFYDKVFMGHAARSGKQRWGEKTPSHVWHIERMARIFPDAQFVGIVRHPAACVASNVRRWGYGLQRSIRHYERYNREILRQAAELPDRFVVLRYEDLVLRSEQVMRELLEWLGEPWSDSVLAHHRGRAGEGAPAVVEGYSRADEPIDPSRTNKWRASLGQPAVSRIEDSVGRLGAFLGYTMADAADLSPLTNRPALVISGRELAARFTDFPELDLEAPNRVPVADSLYDPHVVRLAPAEEPPPPPPAMPRRIAIAAIRRMPRGLRRRLLRAARRLRPRRRRVRSPAVRRANRRAKAARRSTA